MSIDRVSDLTILSRGAVAWRADGKAYTDAATGVLVPTPLERRA